MLKLVVLSSVLGAAVADLITPIGYTAPLAYSAAILTPSNYRGPLSLAPGQPANVLGADGRPLDTLDVNLDRAAHFTAKTFNNVHLLKKRSVAPFIEPVSPIALAPSPVIAKGAPLAYTAPLAYSAAILTPSNYRGPLSLAPGQPTNILGADGRPLDTLDVKLHRAAHFTAKALSGVHLLKKRSVTPFIAPVSHIALATPTVIAHGTPITYTAPITYAATPIASW